MITEDELDIAIEKFAKTISKHELGLVYHIPTPESSATNCLSNVLAHVQRNGGGIKYGWTFHHRVSAEFGEYLFATHHAVWHAPDGHLIDITPFHEDSKHHPITQGGSVLFLLDDEAQPIQIENYGIPLPLKYFAIQNNSNLRSYVKKLREKELKFYKDEYGITFER